MMVVGVVLVGRKKMLSKTTSEYGADDGYLAPKWMSSYGDRAFKAKIWQFFGHIFEVFLQKLS